MPATTTKLGLKKPYESEYFDINVFNENADTIDALTHIVASGTATSYKYQINAYSVPNGTVTWRYKKYSDGTLEAQCTWVTNNWICNEKTDSGIWRSGYVKVDYPDLGQTSLFYKNATVCSSSATWDDNWAWVIDATSYGEITTYQHLIIGSLREETDYNLERSVFMEFKGTWQ